MHKLEFKPDTLIKLEEISIIPCETVNALGYYFDNILSLLII